MELTRALNTLPSHLICEHIGQANREALVVLLKRIEPKIGEFEAHPIT
jgi:hypothetical protein